MNEPLPTTFSLSRNAFGKLVLVDAAGQTHEGVAPVRAFPIQAPDDGIALVSTDGREVGWIERLDGLPVDIRTLVEDELSGREFMPEISAILDVTSYATPCTWSVETDRGATRFVLRGEEDIRRVDAASLLISDSHGIHFLIRDMHTMDRLSRKILDRFL
ncbi:MAG: hypothetical protein ACI9ZF_003813 [Bradyrhizobium sp.]|jgi:hypothetical protein